MIDEYLQRAGVGPAEIKQVMLVSMPQAGTEQALRLKQVDAAVLADVFRERAIAAGVSIFCSRTTNSSEH
jgi:ABC-type nitrate/sulfonate/bicarbonate transport system substrate-binding protein